MVALSVACFLAVACGFFSVVLQAKNKKTRADICIRFFMKIKNLKMC
jgi:hypothetical protein